jgi:hypothetical protein
LLLLVLLLYSRWVHLSATRFVPVWLILDGNNPITFNTRRRSLGLLLDDGQITACASFAHLNLGTFGAVGGWMAEASIISPRENGPACCRLNFQRST